MRPIGLALREALAGVERSRTGTLPDHARSFLPAPYRLRRRAEPRPRDDMRQERPPRVGSAVMPCVEEETCRAASAFPVGYGRRVPRGRRPAAAGRSRAPPPCFLVARRRVPGRRRNRAGGPGGWPGRPVVPARGRTRHLAAGDMARRASVV